MAWTEAHGSGHRGIYRDSQGVKRRTRTFPNKRSARQAAADEEAKIREGTWFDPTAGRITFRDYFEDHWLPNRAGELRTVGEYRSVYRSNLKAEFGGVELRKILSSTVQGWVNAQVKAGVSANTIHARFKVLQTVLAARKGVSARRDQLIRTNPCEGVQMPVIPTREVTILKPDQVYSIIDALDPWWRPLPLLAAETGLRWGELMGLAVSDFDLNCRSLLVRRTIVEGSLAETGNGTGFVWKAYPKTKRSRRVSLAAHVSTAVQDLIAERRLGPEDRLFSMPDKAPPAEWAPPLSLEWTPLRHPTWPEGLPIAASFFRRSVWKPALSAAGILNHRTFRDLRASHISWLLAAGADLPTVMERVGHNRFETTRRYTAVLPSAEDRALAALDKVRKFSG